MSLSILGRQQTAVRSSVARTCLLCTTRTQRRRKHNVPALTHEKEFKKHGVKNMLSREGFETAWTDYQSSLVHWLNSKTTGIHIPLPPSTQPLKPPHRKLSYSQLSPGTADENVDTKTLLLKYARQASHAALFNHASAAHNNHIFFSSLTPSPSPSSSNVPPPLLSQISASFSSLDSLRATFLATADAMFGPGFVWLVRLHQPRPAGDDLAILNTYIAGSPYPDAHFRRQEFDMNTYTTGITSDLKPGMYAERFGGNSGTGSDPVMGQYVRGYGTGNMNAGSYGPFSKSADHRAPGGARLEVLLAVSTWEHVWLRDWGVGGKRGFLEAWWDAVDWEVVMERYGKPSQGRR
ncbi:MAG: hypothetical protein LQ342_007261 [Letrouitia transgressa]|nr:MAG: hypothetical protein LQ342_007261 [Letrouitia transgressa]